MKKTRWAAKNNETYKEVVKVLEAICLELLDVGLEGDDGEMYDEDKKRERQRKKRKILKPFREYNNRNRDEGRFKGGPKEPLVTWLLFARSSGRTIQSVANSEKPIGRSIGPGTRTNKKRAKWRWIQWTMMSFGTWVTWLWWRFRSKNNACETLFLLS